VVPPHGAPVRTRSEYHPFFFGCQGLEATGFKPPRFPRFWSPFLILIQEKQSRVPLPRQSDSTTLSPLLRFPFQPFLPITPELACVFPLVDVVRYVFWFFALGLLKRAPHYGFLVESTPLSFTASFKGSGFPPAVVAVGAVFSRPRMRYKSPHDPYSPETRVLGLLSFDPVSHLPTGKPSRPFDTFSPPFVGDQKPCLPFQPEEKCFPSLSTSLS